MGLEAPVGGRIHAGGGEGTHDAHLVLAGLHIFDNSLEGFEVVDLGNVSDLGILQADVLGHQVLVVDDAVGLDNVGNTHNGVALLQDEVVGLDVLVQLGAGQISAVLLPGSQTLGAVDLEQGGSVFLDDLGSQGLLVGAGSSGHDGDLNAGLSGIGLGQVFPLLSLFGLEVEVVHRAGGLCSGEAQAGQNQRQRQDQRNDLLHG